MPFLDRLYRRRPTLYDIPGFAGGNLGDLLDQNPQKPATIDDIYALGQQPDRQVLTPTNQQAITRPRTATQSPLQLEEQLQARLPTSQLVDDLQERPMSGATRPRSVNPFLNRLLTEPQIAQGQSRERRTQPRDMVADDSQYLSDIQNKPLSFRDKLGLASQVIARNLGGEPLPTRRQRDLAKAQGLLQQDLAVSNDQYRQRSLQSQMDAREQAAAAAEERLRQGDEGLRSRADALKQKELQDYHSNLIRVYNAQTDFDPDDPNNADFVAEWQRAFGYRPKKNIRGSQMAVIQGYRPDGTPIVSVVNKGNQTATEVKGAVPTTTEGQLNREQRQRIVDQTEAGKTSRVAAAQAGKSERAGMRQGGALTTDRASMRKAAELTGKIESAKQAMAAADERLKRDPNNRTAKEDREAARRAGEAWAVELNNLNAGYEAGPGEQGYPYYKRVDQAAPQTQQAAPLRGRTISEENFKRYKKDHGDAEAQKLLDSGVTIRQ